MSDALKSTFDVGQGTQSATSGQAGRNNGPMGNDNNPAQYIKTFAFREMDFRAGTVDGSFTAQMKPESPGTGPAGPSPRPACAIKSAMDAPFGSGGTSNGGEKDSSGGGNTKSAMSY